ncbi:MULTISPECIES: hypothetical protein [Microbacterium]|uniref:Flagellar biosynthesis protein FlhA n=1 Tax=Microbacterium schleiferi TaxID=69362 RepID=A0ABU7V4P2_9MICO|nr:hypothetical protein [Microbacterium sp. 67-17]MBD3753395.1 hypothetical protein [Micrococcales bacterium]OJW01467.1 MAG: hypothetical protein BGO47_13490 [Microbacterium sp. 67-17]
MNKGTLWTILGVIAAIVIAWILVELLWGVALLIVKLVVVAVVALFVFFLLRAVFSRSSSE